MPHLLDKIVKKQLCKCRVLVNVNNKEGVRTQIFRFEIPNVLRESKFSADFGDSAHPFG